VCAKRFGYTVIAVITSYRSSTLLGHGIVYI
jgi:hypothetical protein